MGTYGTTHIKKGNKKIDFTDSHDGYFSAMGLNNLLSIKYIDDKTLNKLVDSFNDFEYKDYDDFEITQRQIEDVIYQVEKDNPAASNWIKQALSDDIRPSVTGFGPILYLQTNISYNDSSSAQYIIDLDKKEFQYICYSEEKPVFTIPFAKIRKAPESLIRYLGNHVGNDFELLENSQYENLEEKFNQLQYNKEHNKKDDKKEQIELKSLQKQLQAEIDAVFNIPLEKIEAYDKKQEEERLKWLNENEERMKQFNQQYNIEEEESGGFSIRSNNNITLPQLRKIITYLQKTIKVNPDAKFLEDLMEWGINEDNQSGGFRIFSPKKSSQDAIYNKFLQTLEYTFKIGMNGFSSSGTYSSEPLDETNELDALELSAFGEVQGPQKSIFSIDEICAINPEWKNIVEDADSTLVFNVYYEEAREIVLSTPLAHVNYSIVWFYAALLNQDREVVEKVYPTFNTLYSSIPEETQKMVGLSLLKSLSDGEHINSLLGIENNSEFYTDIKKNGLLDTLKPYMNKKETSQYFPSKTKKLK